MKKIIYLFFIILTSVFLIEMQSCGSSKKSVAGEDQAGNDEQEIQNDYQEIERLLGITREKTTQTPPANKENNDLLKLLEVDEGKKENKTVPVKPVQPIQPEKQLGESDNKVDVAQQDSQRKAREMRELSARSPLKDTGKISTEGNGSLPTRERTGPSPVTELSPVESPRQYAYESYKADYDKGLSYFHERRYSAAVVVFEQLLAVDTHNFQIRMIMPNLKSLNAILCWVINHEPGRNFRYF
jgi:TolA-binding protein